MYIFISFKIYRNIKRCQKIAECQPSFIQVYDTPWRSV